MVIVMPSPPLIDIEELLTPIPGDSPAGGSVPFTVREKLEECRKEIHPDDFDPNDPMRPEAAQKADWATAARVAAETLTRTSKDLLVAARLTEAITRHHGFGGLRDGLRLLRRMVTECWDRLHPLIESEDDLEVRAAPLHWLDEPDRGARFPNSVRQVPMLQADGARYSWLQWKEAQTGRGNLSTADFDKAILAASREDCQAAFDDLTEAWQELDTLARELNGLMGSYAPSLSGLRQAVGECRTLAQQILQRKGPGPAQAGEPVDNDAPAVEGEKAAGRPTHQGSFVAQQIASRAQVYQQLAEAAAILQQIEPHSPIPYLINRVVELGGLRFPELMRELIRDAEVLSGMNRELGIKPPEE